MQNFFITGASGWLGHNLIEYFLEQDIKAHNIHAFCLPSENINFLTEKKINIFKGDIRDIKSIKNFLEQAREQTVIHLSGVIHPRLKTADFFDINYLGTKHIVEISQKIGVKKIILMSSNSPIGCNKSNKDEDIFTEESEFNPYMKYGQSKFLMEKFALNFIAHNQHPKITIIRAPWFYGPHQPMRQTFFLKMIKEGKFPIVGDGRNKRSMAYTKNLSQGILLASLSEKSAGKTYWIADKKPYKINEIIDTIKEVMEKEFNIKCKNKTIKLPSIVSNMAYLTDEIIQGCGFYQQKIHVLSEMNKNIFCSIKKAEEELGYKPEFNLYEGMKKNIKWCIENKITF